MTDFRTRPATTCALLGLLAACASGDERTAMPEVVRTDSAGVEIVTTPTAAADVPLIATLDSVPTLRIGALDGSPEEQFGDVSDLLALPGGGVAVLDGQAAEIRVFGPDGAFVRTIGAKGEGPGELTSPGTLGWLAGDSIAVYDRRAGRVTRFAVDGSLGSVVTLDTGPAGRPFRATFMADGALAGETRLLRGAPPAAGKNEVGRDTTILLRFAPDGALTDTLVVAPGMESMRRIEISATAVNVFKRPTVFGPGTYFAPSRAGLWVGDNARFEVRLLDARDGHLIRVVRAPGLERPTSEARAVAIRDAMLADAESPEQRRDVETLMEMSPRPTLEPAYDRIFVDDRDRLWLRQWNPPPLGASPRVWVFGPAGELLGGVDVPEGTELYAVRCGAAWGVERDEYDVSYVVRYALGGPLGC